MPLFHTTITGIVQGVGFRPFIANLARKHRITGTVANKGPYVEIYAQGPASACAAFHRAIQQQPPARAIILTLHTQELPESTARFQDFQIIESEREQGPIYVSPDIATCDDCARELYDPENPRYLHPFINCTNCGPRLTIQESAPYDRCRTTMKNFPMCDRCEKEYHDPKNRRYDAQPVCCPHCGPHVYLLDSHASASRLPDHELSSAITNARRALISGRILALKGIAGFHPACAAPNQAAAQPPPPQPGTRPLRPPPHHHEKLPHVPLLRRRIPRPPKPPLRRPARLLPQLRPSRLPFKKPSLHPDRGRGRPLAQSRLPTPRPRTSRRGDREGPQGFR